MRNILGHTSLAMIDRIYSHLVPNDADDAMMEAIRGTSERRLRGLRLNTLADCRARGTFAVG